MLVVPTPSVMEPLAQTPQFALTEPSPGSKPPPDSLIGPNAVAAPLAVAGMLNAVSVWLVPLPVLVSIRSETKAVTLFAPPIADVQAPANPSVGVGVGVGVAAMTAGWPLELFCSVTTKVLGCGGGGTSLGRRSALRPERAIVSLDSLPWLPRERDWPS